MIQAAKIIGTGLATTGLIGAGVGIGIVFGYLILGVSRNTSIIGQLFSYAIFGFAFSAEQTDLFALMMAFLLNKDKRVTRDKIKRLPFYRLLISRRPFSTLPPIFILYIKQTLFILTLFILLLYLFLVSIYLIWAIFGILGPIYITPILGDNWIQPDLISYLTENKIIKYILSHKIEILIFYIFYIIIITFYRFCFNKILKNKHIIKYLPEKFAYRLTIKTKLIDIFLYFFTLKFIKYVISCWCLITIPLAGIFYLTDFSFDQTRSIIILIFYVLYISICINIISCILNKQKFWSTDNIFSIIILFLVIFSTKYTLNLIVFIPLLMEDLNISNIVNKPVIKNLNNLPKLLDKLPVINILKLSKILDINYFINRKIYINKSRYIFLNNNQNLDVNKYGLLNKSKRLGNKIPTINYSNLRLSNRLYKGNLGIIDTINSRKRVCVFYKIIHNERSNIIIEERSYFICPSTCKRFYFVKGFRVISSSPKSKSGFDYDSDFFENEKSVNNNAKNDYHVEDWLVGRSNIDRRDPRITHHINQISDLRVNMMNFDNQNQNTGAGQDQDIMDLDNQNQNTGAGQDQDMMNLDNQNQNTGAGEQDQDLLIDDEQQQEEEQQEENIIDLTENIQYDLNSHEDFELKVLNNDLNLANTALREIYWLLWDNPLVENESLLELKTEYKAFFYDDEENNNGQDDIRNITDICEYLKDEIKVKKNINKMNKEKDTYSAIKEKTNKDPFWKSQLNFESWEEFYKERQRVAKQLKDENKNKNPDVKWSKETLHQLATSKILIERNPREYHKLRNNELLRLKRIKDRFAEQITSPNITNRQFEDIIPPQQVGPVQVGTSGIVNWQIARRFYIKEMIYTDPRNQLDTGYVNWINGDSNQPLAFNIAALLDRVRHQGQKTITINMFKGAERKFMVDFINDPNNNLTYPKSILSEDPQAENVLSKLGITNVLVNTLRLLP